MNTLHAARRVIRDKASTDSQLAASCDALANSPHADDRMMAKYVARNLRPAITTPAHNLPMLERMNHAPVSAGPFLALMVGFGVAFVSACLIGWAITGAFTAYNAAIIGGSP